MSGICYFAFCACSVLLSAWSNLLTLFLTSVCGGMLFLTWYSISKKNFVSKVIYDGIYLIPLCHVIFEFSVFKNNFVVNSFNFSLLFSDSISFLWLCITGFCRRIVDLLAYTSHSSAIFILDTSRSCAPPRPSNE